MNWKELSRNVFGVREGRLSSWDTKDQSYVLPERKPSAGLPVCSPLRAEGAIKECNCSSLSISPLVRPSVFYPSFSIFHPPRLLQDKRSPRISSISFPFPFSHFIHPLCFHSVCSSESPFFHPHPSSSSCTSFSPETIVCFLRNLGGGWGSL